MPVSLIDLSEFKLSCIKQYNASTAPVYSIVKVPDQISNSASGTPLGTIIIIIEIFGLMTIKIHQ